MSFQVPVLLPFHTLRSHRDSWGARFPLLCILLKHLALSLIPLFPPLQFLFSTTTPLWGDARPPSAPSSRMCKRGPRSYVSKLRRQQRGFPPNGSSGKSRVKPLATGSLFSSSPSLSKSLDDINTLNNGSVRILQISARSINSHARRAELSHTLEEFQPDILLITETWLDVSTPHLKIDNYCRLSRKDRPGTVYLYRHAYGGTAAYRRITSRVTITHLADSETAERSWHTLHTDTGPFLIGLWCRPPKSHISHIETLSAELDTHTHNTVATLIFGDLNIHHARWLRFSRGNTAAGELLHNISKQYNLTETVCAPTRGPYLLDLVLSSVPNLTSNLILPKIADHNLILTTLRAPPIQSHSFPRSVWDFHKAQWSNLNKTFEATDWLPFFHAPTRYRDREAY